MTIHIHDPDLDARTKAAGASKTVYALVMPQTEAAKSAMLGNAAPQPDAARRVYLERFRDAWTGKQFAAHDRFLEAWMAWASPVADIDPNVFTWRYPTAGASEGLYHAISTYGHRARVEQVAPEVHVFAGDYEGYRAYAEACGIAVVEHARRDWRHVAATLPATALFCLSQPSAIDGNVWRDGNAFLGAVSARRTGPRVLLDLTYVGAIAEPPEQRFAAQSAAVETIVFSLSKPFGVYYDRIGGVLSRSAMPSLFGNQWFKNLTSLQLGSALLARHAVFDLPRAYRPVQLAAARQVGDTLGVRLHCSDVSVLATATGDEASVDPRLAAFLRRPSNDPDGSLRLCLTPRMAAMIGTAGPLPDSLGASS